MENTSKDQSDGKRIVNLRPTAITSVLVQEMFTDAFRASVGRGKPWSRESLAHETGFDTSSIGSWMNGEAVPISWKLIRLCAVLGPDFANRLLAPAGLCGVEWAVADAVSILNVNAVAAGLAAQVAGDMSDGHISPAEEARHVDMVQRLHDVTGTYLARRHRAHINRARLRAVGES